MNLTSENFKRIISPFVFLLLIFFITRCEKETPRAREYPRLTATQIINVSDSGATFSADLYSLGTDTLINHGFVWGFNQEPSINNNRIYLGVPENAGIFRAEITTALSKDQDYYVKSFVQTSERIVYGPATKFKSMGSKGPVIYGFEPDSAAWGDTIKIYGKNFSWVFNQNEVYLNNVSCWTFKSTDTTLFCILDPKVLTRINSVSVRLAGTSNTYIQKQIKAMLPGISGISDENVFWRDTISLILRNLSFSKLPYVQPSAYLGQVKCEVIYKSNDTLKITIPDNVTTIENDLKIQVNGLNLMWQGKVKLKSPVITSFKPAEATWGQKLSIKGRFHPDKLKNTFKIGAAVATITDFCTDSAKILIPASLRDRKNLVYLACNPFNITATDTFRLSAPVIASISPLFGPSGTEVTVTGKYLYNGYSDFTRVKFGNVTATLTLVNNSIIKCVVPSLSNGPAALSLQGGNQTVVSSDSFDVRNPIIFDFYPKTFAIGEEITITGKYFGSISTGNVLFGWRQAQSLISASDTMVVVTTACYNDTIPLRLSIENSYKKTYSSDYFTVLPPVITSVSTLEFYPGQDIIINGDNFNGVCIDDNYVTWCGIWFRTKSATRNKIIVTVPYYGLKAGTAKLKIKVGSYIRFSPVSVTYR